MLEKMHSCAKPCCLETIYQLPLSLYILLPAWNCTSCDDQNSQLIKSTSENVYTKTCQSLYHGYFKYIFFNLCYLKKHVILADFYLPYTQTYKSPPFQVGTPHIYWSLGLYDHHHFNDDKTRGSLQRFQFQMNSILPQLVFHVKYTF